MKKSLLVLVCALQFASNAMASSHFIGVAATAPETKNLEKQLGLHVYNLRSIEYSDAQPRCLGCAMLDLRFDNFTAGTTRTYEAYVSCPPFAGAPQSECKVTFTEKN